MENILVGLVGMGNWGKNLARNLCELGVLKKIYDPNINKKKMDFLKNVDFCHNIHEIMNDKKINCVVVASPAITHKEISIHAIEKNKHVFVEKPFCLSLKDASAISEKAKIHNKIIFVGHLLNYHNGFIELKNQVNKGLIGNINIIKANRLNFGAIRKNESVVYDLLSHDISMILSITKELPSEIQANKISKFNKNNPDTVNVILKFSKNIYANLNADWLSPYKEHRFSILGEKGSLIFDDTLSWDKKLYHNPSFINKNMVIELKEKKFIKIKKEEPLKKELESFFECIKNNIEPITNTKEAIDVQNVLEKIDQKLKIKEVV